ncbi:MAG: 4Fe-4S binding protein [Terriglobales bacterium]
MSAASRVRWTRCRRTVQLAVALFFLVLPFANAAGFNAISGTLVALKIGPVDLMEPAATISAALAGRQFTRALLLGIAPLALLAVVLGPVFCSWICPWGLASEALDHLLRRAHAWNGNAWIAVRRLRIISLVAFLLLAILFATPLVAFLSAPRLATTLPLELVYLRTVSAVTGTLLLALLLLECLGRRRVWCRGLCPVGGLATFLGFKRRLRLGFAAQNCSCPLTAECLLHCPWGIDPRRMRLTDGCTNCLTCVDACPSQVLSPKFQH